MRGETVTVLYPASRVDPYSGEQVPTWDLPPASTTDVLTLAPPEPRPGTEAVVDARNAATEGWTLYLPAGVQVNAWNRITVRGIDYPVQGNPSPWGDTGVVVQCYRVEG